MERRIPSTITGAAVVVAAAVVAVVSAVVLSAGGSVVCTAAEVPAEEVVDTGAEEVPGREKLSASSARLHPGIPSIPRTRTNAAAKAGMDFSWS